MTHKLSNTENHLELDIAAKHDALATFCIYTVFAFSIADYVLLVARLLTRALPFMIITSSLIIVSSCFFYFMIKKTKYPLSLFGLTFKNSKTAIIESVVFSIAICAILTFLKWVLITKTSLFTHEPLLIFDGIYTAFAPLQAFILHSAWQSPLMLFLPKNRRNNIVILLLPSLAFGSMHTDYNVIFSLLVMTISFFWCVLFVRHKTIVGVSISHIIVGIYAMQYLNIINVTQELASLF
jgi:hypothetical protein